jgi:hypothetical protein
MLANRVFRKLFGPKRKEIKGSWMYSHKREDNLTGVIEWKMMIFAGHVSCMGEKKFVVFGS